MKELEKRISVFLKTRNWDTLRPVDIAKSIMIESAELLEIFQWENLSLEETKADKGKMAKIRKELADVFIYGIEMSLLLGLDTEKIIRCKLAAVVRKYPAKLMRETKKLSTQSIYWRIKHAYRKHR